MFDQSTDIHIAAPMDAVLAAQPVRIELGDEVHWLRPSNVLRIEAKARANRPEYLYIWLTDGGKIWLSAFDMELKELHALADSVAAALWPSAADGHTAHTPA